MQQFDPNKYRDEFLKKHRGARGAPGDLMTRYAITLPATDAEIGAQLRAVRTYWNTIYNGATNIAKVASNCRAEDQRLQAEHGAKMETLAWWQAKLTEQQQAAEGSIATVADELRRHYGSLGVVPERVLGQYTVKLGLTPAQASQAAERARVEVIGGVTLPVTQPIANFGGLVGAMSQCGALSVPVLVHPGAGDFRLVDRFEYIDPARRNLRLDAVAVAEQKTEADKRGTSVTDNARRSALGILAQAVRDGVDLRDVALHHMVTIAQESVSTSVDMAAADLRKAGLDKRDAAIVAVLVAEQSGGPGGPANKVPVLLGEGRLSEARAAALSLPAGGDARAEAAALIEAAQRELDRLLAAARAALAASDEARAEALLRDAALISGEDANRELAAVPLPPPADLRAAVEGTAVRLFWRPAAGHSRDTVYAVRRTTQPRALTAHSEGEAVFRDRGDTAADAHPPVARPVQYAVFALGDGRPPSRPAGVTITPLPPVSGLTADAGTATVALRWIAHPDATVRVTRTVPGGAPRRAEVNGNSCQVSGLTEGQQQHFEVIAVYRAPGGGELASAPEHVSATPQAQARPLSTLQAEPVSGGRVRITWVPADNSTIRVVRADREPAASFGKTISEQEMTAVGSELSGTPISAGKKTGFETVLPPGIHRLVPFSKGGTGVVVGKMATVAVTDPVSDLSWTAFAEYATLSWRWPERTQLAEVYWRLDGEEDVTQVDLGQYRSGGGFRVPLGRGPCHVEVRAMITVGGRSFTSAPVTAEISQVVEAAIRYTVSNTGPSVGPFGGRKKKVVFTADEPCAGVRVVMVARQGPAMPTSRSEGMTILDTELTTGAGVPAEFRVTVPGSISKPFWVRCFVAGGQARLIDPMPITSLKES